MNDIYKIYLKEYYWRIVFDDAIADLLSNKKLNNNWGRKLIISIAFVTQSYFVEPNYANF